MKNIFLFIAILISFNSFSQKFTLNQLENLYETDNSFFNTFAVGNDYQFASANDSIITYNYKDGSLYNRLEIETLPGMFDKGTKERCIAWTFTSADNYLAIKNELADKKFQLFQTLNGNNDYTSAEHFYYSNKVLMLRKFLHITFEK